MSTVRGFQQRGIYQITLNMLRYSFGMIDVNDNYQAGFARAHSIAEFDYNKAIKGIGYCVGESWSDHEKFA
jgi:hypothetical protein